MADSKTTMARLVRLERDSSELKKMLARIVDVLSDQSERIDGVGERIDGVGERIDGVGERVTSLGQRLDQLGDRLGDRLDRLIAVTIQARTDSIERIADIERRLTRLEERSGL